MSDPPTTTMPIPPPTEPRKRRWLVPTAVGVGAFLLGLIIGVAGTGSNETTTTAGPSEPPVSVTGTATVTDVPSDPPAAIEESYTPLPYTPLPPPDYPAELAVLADEIGCSDWVGASEDTPHARAWGTCEFDGSTVRLYAFGSWVEQESFVDVAPMLGINPDLTIPTSLELDIQISAVPDDLAVFNDLESALTKAAVARLQSGS